MFLIFFIIASESIWFNKIFSKSRWRNAKMINNSIKYKHYAQIIAEILMHNTQKRQNKLTIIYYHDNVFSSQK